MGVPFFGSRKTPKTAIFGVFRHPKKGTFGNRNFSKRLILQSVGKNEQMDAVSYCFGHFKAVFSDFGRFWGGFWKLDAQKKRHFPDSKIKSVTTLKIYF